MSNSITLKDLKPQVSSNRTTVTCRSVINDAFFKELPKRTCFGGKKYGTYAEFRKAVIDTAIYHPVVGTKRKDAKSIQRKYQVAALNFNNLREDVNDVVGLVGGLEINGTVYTPTQAEIGRDPAKNDTSASSPKIPSGKWLVVNKTTNKADEGLSSKSLAEKICDTATQRVMSRKAYAKTI